MPKSTRTFRAPSVTAQSQRDRARPLSPSPASDDDIDDLPHHSRPHRPRHDPTATKRVTVRKTPEQVRALNIAFQQLGARPSQSDRRRLALEIGLVSSQFLLPASCLLALCPMLCLGWQRGPWAFGLWPFDATSTANDIIQSRLPRPDPGAFSFQLKFHDSMLTHLSPLNSLKE